MDVITEMLGVEPVAINSNLVSAQNRHRLYWTNIPMDGIPEDRGIVLSDILEDGCTDRDKSHCIDANYFKGGNLKSYFEKHWRPGLQGINLYCNKAVGACRTRDWLEGSEWQDTNTQHKLMATQQSPDV